MVRVGIDGRAGERVDAIDKAAVMPIPGADPGAKEVGDQRTARRGAGFVVGRAVLRRGHFGAIQLARRGCAGFVGDEPNGPAFRAPAEQNALRPAQHFDPREIECEGIRVVEHRVRHLDGRVVDVDAGGGIPFRRADAADRNVGQDTRTELRAEVVLDPGRNRGQSADVVDCGLAQPVGRQYADAHGHGAQQLVALHRGYHDLVERHFPVIPSGLVGGGPLEYLDGPGAQELVGEPGTLEQPGEAIGHGHTGRYRVRELAERQLRYVNEV